MVVVRLYQEGSLTQAMGRKRVLLIATYNK